MLSGERGPSFPIFETQAPLGQDLHILDGQFSARLHSVGERAIVTRGAIPNQQSRGSLEVRGLSSMSQMQRQPSAHDAELVDSMLASTRLGKWQDAFDQANQVALSETATPEQLASAGRILEIAGVSSDAERLYRRFAKNAPRLLYPRFRLCHVLARAGLLAEARELLGVLKSEAPFNVRLIALEALLLPATSDDRSPPGLWRRWFRGEAAWHEGSAVPQADMSAIVIGFRNQPGLGNAVRSLLEQDEGAEIVVVNSGGGDPERSLADCASRLRIINIREPLYVGAARNIGIDASVAAYVSFLAGDCTARPGWISARLTMHRRGSRAVASAIAPPDEGDSLAMAAHLSLFGARSPQVPPAQALRYGASYDRRIFAEFGYFNPALRIGEDTDFAKRIGRKVLPAWTPGVQTKHAGPVTVSGLAFEMFGRGRRSALHQAQNTLRSPWRWDTTMGLVQSVRQRHAVASRIADEILRIEARHLAPVRTRLWIASAMHGIGAFVGLMDRHRIDRMRKRSLSVSGDPTAALRFAQRAARQDPENVTCLLECAQALGLDNDGDARKKAASYLGAAERLSRFRESRMLDLADWLVQRGLHENAWMLGDTSTFELPGALRIHEVLALAAHERGDVVAFELAALDAIARNSDDGQLRLRFQAFHQAGSIEPSLVDAR